MNTSKVALALCAVLFALPAGAQVALKSDMPSILFWTPEQQSTGYRTIEKIYKVVTVKHGLKVHALPKAAKQLSPTWTYADRRWTVADYMRTNSTPGVLALK